MSLLALAIQLVLLLAACPVLAGLRGWVDARGSGSTPPPLQPVRDLRRLWRKSGPTPSGASLLWTVAPPASLAAALLAGLLTPSFTLGTAAAGMADLVVITMLLLGSRAIVAAAAFDAGSTVVAHAAAGTSRAPLAVLPVALLVALAAATLSGTTNLDAAAVAVRDGGPLSHAAGLCAGLALLILATTEPAGGGELGGGRARALCRVASLLRRVAALSVAAAPILPGGGWATGLLGWAVKLVLLALLARLAARWPLFPAAAALLAGLAVVLAGAGGAA